MLAFSRPAMSQNNLNNQENYHDLRGLEDATGTVYLFYGYYHLWTNNIGNINLNDDVVKFNTITGTGNVFLHADYAGGSGQEMIIDYAFLNRDPDNYIFATYASNFVDVSTGIERRDFSGCSETYDGNGFVSLGNIGVADSSNRVYAAYGTDHRTMISTDSGKHWNGVDDIYPGSNPDPDSTISANFLSVAPFDENLAFFNSTTSDHAILKRTKDGGDILAVVDTSSGNWQKWQRPFYYDRDTLHVYTIVSVERNNKIWFKLRGSAKQGDAGSWQTLYEDTTKFYISLDHDKSGSLFIARGREIYKFDNYGANVRLNQTPWQTLPETSVPIIGIYKHPGEDIVYTLTSYSLLKVTSSGIYTLSKIITDIDKPISSQKPVQYVLHQNYPNPFNPTTTIRYELAQSGPVRLAVYNSMGQLISMLVNARQTIGSHQVTFNASQLSSGVYFYRLRVGNKVLARKMLLIK